MSSSISSSDAAGRTSEAAWLRFAVSLVGVAFFVLVAIVALAYAVDPYDSGRSGLFDKPGVRPQGPRTANASRGRDPSFNAMIVGNSHIQIVSPERLKESTGLDFVQLSVPGSGPKEHLAMTEWFLRHRSELPKAVVMGVDDFWCRPDPSLRPDNPFPFWLYSADPAEYVGGLLRYDLLEELPRRIGYLAERGPERARPDGYWDYEPEYLGLGFMTNPALRKRLNENLHANARKVDRDPQEGQRRFPAVERLKELAASLPDETALILVIPPVYRTLLPPSGTERAFAEQACKAAIATVAQGRGRTAVIDWRTDRPENRNPAFYFDPSHYRQAVARAVERDIAGAIRHDYP